MRSVSFPRSVSIVVGLGFPHEVGNVLEAYQLLNEWSENGRGPKHLPALRICAAVLGGYGTAIDALEAFQAFAEDRGILATDALQRSANALGKEWQAI